MIPLPAADSDPPPRRGGARLRETPQLPFSGKNPRSALRMAPRQAVRRGHGKVMRRGNRFCWTDLWVDSERGPGFSTEGDVGVEVEEGLGEGGEGGEFGFVEIGVGGGVADFQEGFGIGGLGGEDVALFGDQFC